MCFDFLCSCFINCCFSHISEISNLISLIKQITFEYWLIQLLMLNINGIVLYYLFNWLLFKILRFSCSYCCFFSVIQRLDFLFVLRILLLLTLLRILISFGAVFGLFILLVLVKLSLVQLSFNWIVDSKFSFEFQISIPIYLNALILFSYMRSFH